jgi:hypothetical protein
MTGGTLGPIGAQWERADDDREIARRVLNMFADRRLLWKDFSLEIEEHCVQSANRVRDELGQHLNNPEIGGALASQLRLLQGLFREFVDLIGPVGDHYDRQWRPMGTDVLSEALGRLRALVGVQIGLLAAQFDLEVSDELASIVPDGQGWFFEAFAG